MTIRTHALVLGLGACLALVPAARAAEPAPGEGALVLTVQGAVQAALERNEAFRAARLGPAIARTGEAAARAAFDPALSASLQHGRATDSPTAGADKDTESTTAGLRVKETFGTGTTIDAGVGRDLSLAGDAPSSKAGTTSEDVTLTQPLLRGRGREANTLLLRTSRLDTEISAWELAGAAEALVAQVEQACWDYQLSGRSVAIQEQSLDLTLKQAGEARERVRVGTLAPTELAAAEAEVASQKSALIDARNARDKLRLGLLRLLNPAGQVPWGRELVLEDSPEGDQAAADDAEAHAATAMEQRPDLRQARLEVAQGELQVAQTRNGLLPRLDLFVRLGGTQYARSFSSAPDSDGDTVSGSAGLSFSLPLGNREAKAKDEKARLSLERARLALRNMEQLAQVEVRSAWLDLQRAGEQERATAATRALREQTGASEEEKLRLGKSTSLAVAQAHRDLVAARLAEARAAIDRRKALLTLHRLDGTLLARRGIGLEDAPERQ